MCHIDDQLMNNKSRGRVGSSKEEDRRRGTQGDIGYLLMGAKVSTRLGDVCGCAFTVESSSADEKRTSF